MRPERQDHADLRPLAYLRGDRGLAAGLGGALLHGEEAEAGGGTTLAGGVEPLPLILDQHHQLSLLDLDAQAGAIGTGVMVDVAQRFLPDPVHDQGQAGGAEVGDHPDLHIHRQAVAAPGIFGELLEGQAQVALFEGGRVEPVGEPSDRDAEVSELAQDPFETARVSGDSRRARLALEEVEFVAEHGDALGDVIVDLTRHPGPLFILGLEQVLAVGLLQLEEAALRQHQRRREGDHQHHEANGGGDEEGPEEFAGVGHRCGANSASREGPWKVPQVTAANARMTSAARRFHAFTKRSIRSRKIKILPKAAMAAVAAP